MLLEFSAVVKRGGGKGSGLGAVSKSLELFPRAGTLFWRGKQILGGLLPHQLMAVKPGVGDFPLSNKNIHKPSDSDDADT